MKRNVRTSFPGTMTDLGVNPEEIQEVTEDIDSLPSSSDEEQMRDDEDESSITFESVKFDHGVQLTLPADLNKKLRASMNIVQPEDREDIPLKPHEVCASELFRFHDQSEKKKWGAPSIYFKSNFEKRITMDIPLTGHFNPKLHSCVALVKVGADWTRKKAVYKAGKGSVSFHLHEADFVILVTEPRSDNIVLTPEGLLYRVPTDKKKQITFPENCVENITHLNIKVLTVDTDIIENLKHRSSNYGVANVSDCIYVEHDNVQFNRPIDVQLPFTIGTDEDDDDEFELRVVHMKGRDIEILDMNIFSEFEDENCFRTSVESLSGYNFVRVRKGSADSLSTKMEIKLALTLMSECTLLSFTYANAGIKYFWLECVAVRAVDQVVESRKSQGLTEIKLSRSQNIYLYDTHRIRVSVRGALQMCDPHKKFYFIRYLRISNDNHVCFPAQISHRVGGQPFGVIEFQSDNFGKNISHVVHYNIEKGKAYWRSDTVPSVPAFLQRSLTEPDLRAKNRNSGNNTPRLSLCEEVETPRPGPSGNTRAENQTPRSNLHGNKESGLAVNRNPQTLNRANTMALQSPVSKQTDIQKDEASGGTDITGRPSVPIGINTAKRAQAPYPVQGSHGQKHISSMAFFSERSLGSLARSIPSHHDKDLALELLGNSDRFTQIEKESSEENRSVVLDVLIHWINQESESNPDTKLQKLCDALEELDLSKQLKVVNKVYTQNRALRRKDFQ